MGVNIMDFVQPVDLFETRTRKEAQNGNQKSRQILAD